MTTRQPCLYLRMEVTSLESCRLIACLSVIRDVRLRRYSRAASSRHSWGCFHARLTSSL